MNTDDLDKLITQALDEDAADKDVTTNSLIPAERISTGVIFFKEDAVLCGLDIAKKVFEKIAYGDKFQRCSAPASRYNFLRGQKLDNHIQFQTFYKEGAAVRRNSKVAAIKGKTRTLLTGERTALNFLGYLSGIATHTRQFVQKVQGTKARIFDTRKTTPGLRWLEKYAVKCAGGCNHRSNLEELVLIKDNHREACRPELSIPQAIQKIRTETKKTIEIEVEVDTLVQFKQALTAAPDIILLDNMNCTQMKKAVAMVRKMPFKKRPLLEASGRITPRRVGAVARTGVDRISIGSLTHSHQSIDVSMELIR